MKQLQTLLYSLFLLLNIAKAQVTITGPSCVTPDIGYRYVLSGLDSSLQTNICITGGTLVDMPDSCISTMSNILKVTWKNNALSGKITVTAGGVVTSLDIGIIQALSGGIIDSLSLVQHVGYDSIPLMIICSPASGGDCNTGYAYQWEQSENEVDWQPIDSATGESLAFAAPLTKSLFYRRKTVETSAGSFAYSNIATVFTGPPPPSASMSNQTGAGNNLALNRKFKPQYPALLTIQYFGYPNPIK